MFLLHRAVVWVGESFHLGPKVYFLLPLHKVIFWVWIGKGSFILFFILRLLWIGFNVVGNKSCCLKMKVWAFKVLSFEIGDLDYLMSIGEKFLFVKTFFYLCIGIDRKWFGFVLGWFESHERKFYRILKFCKICVQWLVWVPMTSLASNDQFWVQWSVLSLVASFDVDAINFCFLV